LISKVGLALLSSSGLDETLNQVASLVFEAVPAERCVIMLRDETAEGGMKITVARVRGKDERIEEVRISRTVMDEVMKNGKSVLTSDAQHDPRYASQTMALLGIRSVLAVPLSVDVRDVFGIIYADSPTYEATFTEEHLEYSNDARFGRRDSCGKREPSRSAFRARAEWTRNSNSPRNSAAFSAVRLRPKWTVTNFRESRFRATKSAAIITILSRGTTARMMIALGDVSGKGTAAALLMSSLARGNSRAGFSEKHARRNR
jgi:hypothetical protein